MILNLPLETLRNALWNMLNIATTNYAPIIQLGISGGRLEMIACSHNLGVIVGRACIPIYHPTVDRDLGVWPGNMLNGINDIPKSKSPVEATININEENLYLTVSAKGFTVDCGMAFNDMNGAGHLQMPDLVGLNCKPIGQRNAAIDDLKACLDICEKDFSHSNYAGVWLEDIGDEKLRLFATEGHMVAIIGADRKKKASWEALVDFVSLYPFLSINFISKLVTWTVYDMPRGQGHSAQTQKILHWTSDQEFANKYGYELETYTYCAMERAVPWQQIQKPEDAVFETSIIESDLTTAVQFLKKRSKGEKRKTCWLLADPDQKALTLKGVNSEDKAAIQYAARPDGKKVETRFSLSLLESACKHISGRVHAALVPYAGDLPEHVLYLDCGNRLFGIMPWVS